MFQLFVFSADDKITLNLLKSDIVKIKACFVQDICWISIRMSKVGCEKIRKSLNMNKESGSSWYDVSAEESSLQLIVIRPEKITDEHKSFFLRFYSGVFDESYNKNANRSHNPQELIASMSSAANSLPFNRQNLVKVFSAFIQKTICALHLVSVKKNGLIYFAIIN